MKRRLNDPDEPVGRLRPVPDFLPPPDQLVVREPGIKVTLSLSRQSVEFFKQQAVRSQVPYQKMIRNLLDAYAARYQSGAGATRRRPA